MQRKTNREANNQPNMYWKGDIFVVSLYCFAQCRYAFRQRSILLLAQPKAQRKPCGYSEKLNEMLSYFWNDFSLNAIAMHERDIIDLDLWWRIHFVACAQFLAIRQIAFYYQGCRYSDSHFSIQRDQSRQPTSSNRREEHQSLKDCYCTENARQQLGCKCSVNVKITRLTQVSCMQNSFFCNLLVEHFLLWKNQH